MRPIVKPGTSRAGRAGAGVLGMALLALAAGCGSKPPPAAPPTPKGAPPVSASTNAAPAAATNTYLAVFVDDVNSGGKDPFFPRSRRRAPAAASAPGTTASVATTGGDASPPSRAGAPANLVLKAILSTSTRRLATINRTTLAEGEEATIRFTGGKATVKCLEIKDSSVVLMVDGQRQELVFGRKQEGEN